MKAELIYVLIIMGLESTLISKPYIVLVGTLSLAYESQEGMDRDCLSYTMTILKDFTEGFFL